MLWVGYAGAGRNWLPLTSSRSSLCPWGRCSSTRSARLMWPACCREAQPPSSCCWCCLPGRHVAPEFLCVLLPMPRLQAVSRRFPCARPLLLHMLLHSCSWHSTGVPACQTSSLMACKGHFYHGSAGFNACRVLLPLTTSLCVGTAPAAAACRIMQAPIQWIHR